MRKPRGYWNYEHCYDEAKKFKTKNEFKHGNESAYGIARKNGWLDKFDWFLPQRGKWTYKTCFEEAKKYTHRAQFQKESVSAYTVALKNGWLDNYTWFGNGNKISADKKRIWTKESCYELALKCKSRSDLKNHNAQAYKVSLENGWLDDYTWFRSGFEIFHEEGIKWTYEACREEAKKYKSRSEFCKKCVGGYTRALDRGWIEDFTWLKNENVFSEEADSIYAYFFENNAVYIGRTLVRTQNHRHQNHQNSESDTVYRYAKLNNVDVPPMTIIEDNLTVEEGSKREGYWVDYYRKQNYTILNKSKTGGIGGLGRGKWSKKACYNEALKYKTMDEFYTNKAAAYKRACEKGWIEEYTWLQRKYAKRDYWQNYDNCYDEAKKYNRISDFAKNAPGAYNSATDNGWIDNFTWFIRNTPIIDYTYGVCYDIAKKCKNVTEFIRASSSAYKKAKKMGWLSDYTWLRKVVRWTDEKVLELASNYSSVAEFSKENKGAYGYMLKHFLPQPKSWKVNRPKWTYDTCYAEALKYKTRSDYCRNSKTSYNVARDKGWLDDFKWLTLTIKPHGYWTYDRCHEEAKKYSTKREFEKGSPGAYDAVITNKWMKDFEYLFVAGRKPSGYWNNYDNCYNEALKYSRVSHFKKGCIGAYSSSLKHGWIDKFKWLKNKGQLDLFDQKFD